MGWWRGWRFRLPSSTTDGRPFGPPVELPRIVVAPANASPQTRHNWLATQKEGLAFGPTDAAGSFLPVLLARLGATNIQVGLLSAIPGLVGFLLAVPIGHFLQGRRNTVPWYSRGRLLNQLSLVVIGLALMVIPPDQVVPVILVIIAVGSVIGSFANFSFYAVMDGLAGPNRRYELMSRRWGLKGAATAVSLAAIGWVLAQVPFPNSYQFLYLATGFFALLAFRYARTFRIPDQPPHRPSALQSPVARAGAFVREVRSDRRFLGFVGRHTVFGFGLSMALPLIPLYYVRELGASDAWIGLIGTTQAAMTMTGYVLWRKQARRRGGTWVLVPSVVGAAAFPALLALTHQELIVAVFVGVYGISLAGIELALFDELMRAVPPGQVVRYAALDSSASNFAGMTGPLAGGLLAGAVGIPGALVAASAVSLAGAALFTLSVVRRGRAPEPAGAEA